MKTKLIASSMLIFFASHSVLANDSCIVIGYHEPNTQIYDGPTFCKDVAIKNITVRGPLDVNHCKMTGLTQVSGPLKANHSEFDSIQINSHFSSMKVHLKNQTLDHGNLIFHGAAGFYQVDGSSKIAGQIINGKPAK